MDGAHDARRRRQTIDYNERVTVQVRAKTNLLT
jgi:hypothetical protein